MPARLGHTDRRHPHCPGCGYDLVATVDANRRVCPECGYEFELSELWHPPRPGDWTVGRGLRRAAVSLVLRALVAAPLWGLAVWGTMSLAARMGGRAMWLVTSLALLLGVAGVLVGAILSRRLIDRAGFVSPLLTVITCGVAFAVVTAGTHAADLLLAMTTPHRSMAILFGWISASIWIAKVTLFDDA